MKAIKLTDNNIKEFEKAVQEEMEKAIHHFEKELITIRTGRAHPALVEGIKVVCYGGNTMNLKEVASITTPEARMIVIQPWDSGLMADIEKAITASDLGVTPLNDGNIIRIRLPEITTARRDELAKILSKKTEEAKISVRNTRRDYMNLIRDAEKAKSISEDHSRRLHDTLQKITDKYTGTIDQMMHKKEAEIKIA
jgi:ribosome recycling factor